MTETMSSLPRASLGKIMLFAFPRIGSAVFLGIVEGTILLLYSTGFGVPKSTVSFIISLGYIAIALSQFFFGWVSDTTYTKKWGARKPYVLALAPLLAISALFLLMPQLIIDPSDPNRMKIWLIIWLTMFKISYAVTTPYQAWMAEQFTVYDRPRVSQVQNQFNFIGQVIVALFSLLVMTKVTDIYVADPSTIPPAFLLSLVIFAVIFVGIFYTSALIMPIEPPPTEKPHLMKNLGVILRNKRYLKILLMQGAASIAWVIAGTVLITYLYDVLDFATMDYIIAAGSLVLCSIFFLFIWRLIMKRAGKTRSIRWVFLAGVIVMPFSLIPLLNLATPTMRLIFGVLFIIGYAAVLSGWYMFPYVIFADIAEDDYRQTGVMKAGLYVGFPSITLNIFQAFGTFLLGLFFTYFGKVTVGAITFDYALVVWGPFAALILIGVFFFTRTFIDLDYKWEQKTNLV